jgi:hypothetical protein
MLRADKCEYRLDVDGRSGYGRELSHTGIQEFANKKLLRTASINAPA